MHTGLRIPKGFAVHLLSPVQASKAEERQREEQRYRESEAHVEIRSRPW